MSRTPPPRSMGFATVLTKDFKSGDVLVEVSWFDGSVAHHSDGRVLAKELRGHKCEEGLLAACVAQCYLALGRHLVQKANS